MDLLRGLEEEGALTEEVRIYGTVYTDPYIRDEPGLKAIFVSLALTVGVGGSGAWFERHRREGRDLPPFRYTRIRIRIRIRNRI